VVHVLVVDHHVVLGRHVVRNVVVNNQPEKRRILFRDTNTIATKFYLPLNSDRQKSEI
jgi:hypothetical protein